MEKQPSRSTNPEIGVGPTPELDLRASVATLVKVQFTHPLTGKIMLALERTATLVDIQSDQKVIVKAKPFGGAVRLIHLKPLQDVIGNFHFDSYRSRKESDFRIMICQKSWEKVKEFCLDQFLLGKETVLDYHPARELVEEFYDTLQIQLTPDMYQVSSLGTVFENNPALTDNVRAAGNPTVRIYHIFIAHLVSEPLIKTILLTSDRVSREDLRNTAKQDAQLGGKGRANAMITFPLENLKNHYLSIPTDQRGEKIKFQGEQLDGNVLAVLMEIDTPKYQRIIFPGSKTNA